MTRPPVERVDCLVVGAGVIGLAVARSLALRGREVRREQFQIFKNGVLCLLLSVGMAAQTT